jgi:diguanylate cyclase (GGDEF)-like protein
MPPATPLRTPPSTATGADAPQPGGRLRSRFIRLLVVAVALPAVVLGTLQLWGDYRDAIRELREELRASTFLAAMAIDQFVTSHAAGVALVADAAEPGEAPDLGSLRERYPAFITVLVTDDVGNLVDAQPSTRIQGSGVRVDDRDYFRVPAETGQPYVSNAFRGRGFGSDPLVAVSAPIVREGRFAGVVEGSIRIDRFTALHSAVRHGRRQEMLIVDREGRVIHASAGLPFRFLQAVGDAPFLRDPELADGIGPATRHAHLLRGGGAAWAAATELRSGWRLVLFVPEAPLLATLQRRALTLAAVVLLAVLGALAVASWQLRRLAHAVGAVLDTLQSFAVEGVASRGRLEGVPGELQPVARSIGALLARLEATGAELRAALAQKSALADSLQDAVAAREQVVAERTARLQAANDELERLSRTDPLTGSLNVRGFRAWSEEYVAGDGSLTAAVGVIAMDLDHFKVYNDRYGHPAGDRVLRRVAGAAQASLRDAGDRLVRIGGEEFVAILPGADIDTTRAVAERVRAAVREMAIPHDAAPSGRLSVSLGVVAAERGELLDTVLQLGDEALYRAKNDGRDRIAL